MDSYISYVAAISVLRAFRGLRRPAAIRLLDLLGRIAYYLDAKHRHIALINLTIAFPELSDAERHRIAIGSFQNTARNLLEVSHLSKHTSQSIRSLVRYDPELGLNNYMAARSRGRGILYITGHFSAWELLPAAHALHGYPLSFITRPLDNPLLENHLTMLRQATGNRVISKRKSARTILEILKAGGDVGILMDQNTSLQEGTFADLFGVPAATTTSVALLALRTDATILPGYLSPEFRGRYTVRFLPPVELERTGDMTADVQRNTERFNGIMEQIIREQPESWLWGHKRWKNQPARNPQDLYRLNRRGLEDFLAKNKR